MPPTDPISALASSGIIRIFWFGELANLPSAWVYLSAMK
ncbi:hypothetical protein A6302_03963 [Methylobrevis pamukkalensis]|uniref:Uncharacterized protein n=1 Tax=Methylobrevis pamukkalensis TaxID=1439726 RepID=A0A1E3GZJ1_9HYPH|nr:hypothetical protein A6302_03963 [Methylobrevis pamukkalensis]